MNDDETDDLVLDWGLAKKAARARQPACGDRRDRASDGKRRRSPRGPKAPAPPPRAQMIPFPIGRRRAFVARLAEQVASRPAAAGEAHLLQQLKRQGEVLRRKGVPTKAIEGELRALTAAVRTELWRLLLGSNA